MYVLLDSLVTSIDLVYYIVCYHVFLVVFHLLQVLLQYQRRNIQGQRGQPLREVSMHYIQVINQI